MPDDIPRIMIRLIRRIHPEWQSPFRCVRFNLSACGEQKRAHNRLSDGRDPAQSAQPCPPEQVEDDGLRVVIRIVRGGDDIKSQRHSQPFEERIPERSRGFLDSPFLLSRPFSGISALDVRLATISVGEVNDEPFIAIGLRTAKPVVEVCHDETNLAPMLLLGQKIQQHDGVDTSTYRENNSAAFGQHFPMQAEFVKLSKK
jgi:hypothetical protein